MQLKPDPTTTPANFPSAVPVAALCANCGADERRLLHHVRQRNTLRRLCTTCVLRLHPQSFCPTCFQVYPPSPSNDAVFTCIKCYSASHSHCVSAAPSPYTCPLCLHPNTPIFKLKEVHLESGEGYKVMDRDAAKKLLAAAKIASTSMNKAVVIARAEAEKRAKEASFTRKRAKEALDYVAYLMMKEKVKKEKDALMAVGNNGGYTINVSVNVSTSINRNANVSVGGGLGSSVAIEEKVNNDRNVDSSNRVLAALSAVELRENEGLGMALDDFCDENGDDHVIFGDSQNAEENLDVHGESGGDVSDGVGSVQPVEDHVTYEENGNIEEQLGNGSPQRC